jgi:hypothetical protein
MECTEHKNSGMPGTSRTSPSRATSSGGMPMRIV